MTERMGEGFSENGNEAKAAERIVEPTRVCMPPTRQFARLAQESRAV